MVISKVIIFSCESWSYLFFLRKVSKKITLIIFDWLFIHQIFAKNKLEKILASSLEACPCTDILLIIFTN